MTTHAPPVTRDDVAIAIVSILPSDPRLDVWAQELARLLAALPTTSLPALDEEVRWQESWRSYPWQVLTPSDAGWLLEHATEAGGETATVTVAAGLSLHRNGHIRELAVRRLAAASAPEAFRWLVLRSGDWVPEVRRLALEGVERWLIDEQAEVLVDALPLLAGGRFARGRPADRLPARIESVLASPAARPAVEAGLDAPERAVRRSCTRLLAAVDPSLALLERVLPTHDVVAIAAVAAALPTAGDAGAAVGAILLRSPLGRVRAEGLWRVLPARPSEANAVAERALFDRAAGVREVAQRWLVDAGRDPHARYRASLALDAAAALTGLGDRPHAEDAELARTALWSGEAPVRVAALRLLSALGSPDDEPVFTAAFVRGTATERRLALAGIRRSGGARRVVDAMWEAAAAAGDDCSIVRVLLQVVPLVGLWARLSFGLRAVEGSQPAVAAAGAESLRRALRDPASGYRIRPSELDRLAERFERVRPVLEPTLAAQIGFVLGSR